jgi:hypothetical protein
MTRNIIPLIAALILPGCANTSSSSLVGKWQSNEEKTLASMGQTPGVTDKAKNLFEHNFFGRLINEYNGKTIKSYYRNTSENYEGMDDPTPYTVLEETNEYYLVSGYNKALEKNGATKLYKEGSCYYVFVSKWNFKEYFCRVP